MKIFIRLIERTIRLRNPNFAVDARLSTYALLQFTINQIFSIIRGLKVIMYFKNPSGMLLGNGVKFFNIPYIHWGSYLRLGDFVYISALGKSGVSFGNNVSIGAFSRIVLSTTFNHLGEFIKIGDNVGIGEFAYLGGAGGLEIGNDCIIGQYFSCHPENHNHEIDSMPFRLQGVTRRGIIIGRNCWIGSKVTILDGVAVGDNCVIAAGSVVTKNMPSDSIIGGVPAKILK